MAHCKEVKIQNNLKAIGQACRQYYMGSGQWPTQIGDLQPFFLNASVNATNYTLNPQDNILTITWDSFSETVTKPHF